MSKKNKQPRPIVYICNGCGTEREKVIRPDAKPPKLGSDKFPEVCTCGGRSWRVKAS